MIPGAFVLKLKTRQWRLCIVKQIPEEPSSSFMLFGQNMKDKTTFQMEFKSHLETTLINYLADMTETDETNIALVLVSESPAVSCFESLWSLPGQYMYRKKVRAAFINALYQDLAMLQYSPQLSAPMQSAPPTIKSPPMKSAPPMKSRHSMQTRSKSSA